MLTGAAETDFRNGQLEFDSEARVSAQPTWCGSTGQREVEAPKAAACRRASLTKGLP